MWYQRTMCLQEIANSGEGSLVRRGKAHLLFIRMMARMNVMIEKAIELSRLPVPNNAKPGGISNEKQEHAYVIHDEVIINENRPDNEREAGRGT